MSREALDRLARTRRHGSRARYAGGCRCAACRRANANAYRERDARAKAAALEHRPDPVPVVKRWRARDGSIRTRLYRRGCPGVDRSGCPRRSHLRSDSTSTLCGPCRARLVWNGLVDAAPVRRHLRALSRRGVGYKTVADACDVAKTTLSEVLAGRQRRIRRLTAERVLEVTADAIADGGLVPAGRTWSMIRAMLPEYFSKAEIARRLGYRSPALQLGRRFVTARTEQRVARLYRRTFPDR